MAPVATLVGLPEDVCGTIDEFVAWEPTPSAKCFVDCYREDPWENERAGWIGKWWYHMVTPSSHWQWFPRRFVSIHAIERRTAFTKAKWENELEQDRLAKENEPSSHNFHNLPAEIVAIIKAMKSDRHPPTPSAIAIKEANLQFEYDDEGWLNIWIPRRNGANFRMPRWRPITIHGLGRVEVSHETNIIEVDIDWKFVRWRRDREREREEALYDAWLRVQREGANRL